MSSSATAENLDFQDILARHLVRYPVMHLEDVYKLIHQASLGSQHFGMDIDQAGAWLTNELADLREGPAEPILDPISPDGRILRVHLRPYVAECRDPVQLLLAFVRTADEWEGSIDLLRAYWRCVEKTAKDGHLQCDLSAAREFGARMAKLNYPAIHHSEAYKAAYRPAYRVVAREFLSGPLGGGR
jgi:hypothetical protein